MKDNTITISRSRFGYNIIAEHHGEFKYSLFTTKPAELEQIVRHWADRAAVTEAEEQRLLNLENDATKELPEADHDCD